MLLPAAATPAPIAVLVLAWDEAAPAVRALLAATQAHEPVVDSIVVLVPQADAPGRLSPEEYLPLPLADADLAPAPAPGPAPAQAAPLSEAALASPAPPTVAYPLPPAATPAVAPLPAWSLVRVVRLASLSLPELAQKAGQPLPSPIWTGAAGRPAARIWERPKYLLPLQRLPAHPYLLRQSTNALLPRRPWRWQLS
ncbi:hypothetical protein [Hymenobacter sp. BRD67]|uniref:hypothetical protein n=1 Tax=Hymenobacter sp. BRD67 TaxID=2675877 RepID=UPI001563C081|nr:hypothetical protein [Hymenobacter sp. BRD67]QKG53349.1 hypothetical protein GKZ67_13065 [Hymenobacter sp. BRD67]